MKRAALLLTSVFLLHATALADDLFEILNKLPIQRPDARTQTLNTRFYAASLSMRLVSGDAVNNDFSDNDVMEEFMLSSIGGSISFPRSDRRQFEQFARDHAKEIIDILFPSGLASNIIGQTKSQLSTSLVFDEVVAPTAKPRGIEEKQFKNELSGRLEYNDLEINKIDGYSFGTLLGYRHKFTNGFETGLLLPYRFTGLDDSTRAKAHFAQFDLYGIYTLYDKEVKIRVGADAFASVLISQSDAIDILGDLTYGGGVFSAAERDFGRFIITFGLGFKLSKTSIEFSPNGDDFLSEAIRAINDRDIDKDLVYGFNIAIPHKENLMINFGLHRMNSFSSDVSDERDSQTKVRAVAQYKVSDTFVLNGGYSTIFEIEDFTTHILFLNASYRF